MRRCKDIILAVMFLGIWVEAYALLPLCGVMPMWIRHNGMSTTSETPSTVVTTTLDIIDPDDGLVSLREAILYAIANPSMGRLITFNLPWGSSHTIMLTSPLPTLVGDTLVVDGGNQNICIDGSGQCRLFRLESYASLMLDNLMLAHGYAADGMGGAIYCNSGQLILNHCHLLGNMAVAGQSVATSIGYGGAIYANGGAQVHLCNSVLDSNVARVMEGATGSVSAYGGAMAVSQSANVVIENCRFEGNTAEHGGALFAQTTSALANISIHIGRSCFLGNTADIGGGAIQLTNINSWIHCCTFHANIAPSGGAIHCGGTFYRTSAVTSCTFVENGSALLTVGSVLRIEGSGSSMQLCNNLFVRSTPLAHSCDIEVLGNTATHL